MDIKDAPIGILDSGVGGLTAVAQMNKYLPNESILYFGDTKRMPYGNRTQEEVIYLANQMIAFLEEKGAKAILLACNTISSQIEKLTSNVKLVSIVESGVKSITRTEHNNFNIGVIATVSTVNSGSYEKQFKANDTRYEIISKASTNLPKLIDSNIDDKEFLHKEIMACIDPILKSNKSINKIILGCSHFPIIISDFATLYPHIEFIDPAINQVMHLREYLKEHKMNTEATHPRIINLFTTAETYEYAAAIKRLRLEIDTLMKVKLLAED